MTMMTDTLPIPLPRTTMPTLPTAVCPPFCDPAECALSLDRGDGLPALRAHRALLYRDPWREVALIQTVRLHDGRVHEPQVMCSGSFTSGLDGEQTADLAAAFVLAARLVETATLPVTPDPVLDAISAPGREWRRESTYRAGGAW